MGCLEAMRIERKGRDLDDLVSPEEASEFKSMCGSLSLLSGLTRLDIGREVNMLQKRQASPRALDCLRPINLTKRVQADPELGVRIRRTKGELVTMCWHDSGLYNSYDEEGVEDDEQLSLLERAAVRSKHGAAVGLISASDLESTAPIDMSVVDRLTRASRRGARSTFAAETSASRFA